MNSLPPIYLETSYKITAKFMPEIGKNQVFLTHAHAPGKIKKFTKQNKALQQSIRHGCKERRTAPFYHFTQKNILLHHKLSFFVNCVDNLCQLSNTAGDEE